MIDHHHGGAYGGVLGFILAVSARAYKVLSISPSITTSDVVSAFLLGVVGAAGGLMLEKTVRHTKPFIKRLTSKRKIK